MNISQVFVLEHLPALIDELGKQLVERDKEVERLRRLFIVITNGDCVVDEFGEVIGYVATHSILDQALQNIDKGDV